MATLKHCSRAILLCLILQTLFNLSLAYRVSHDGRAITIDGERKILLSGSIHYPRSTPGMWPDLIKKAKEGGLDAIETYVFWNAHEPLRRQYDFTGNLDLIRFIKTIQDQGLYVILRIGPYVCAEWNYGGFPVWLHNMPGIEELRTTNKVFMNEMQNFTTLIVDMAKKEKLFASQGGPIILAQIENEYGNVMSDYGDAGKSYINWCAKMATSLDIGVPWIMCQESDAPSPMINTCNGFYCDQFTPNNPNSPKIWTENWTGWFKSWGGKDPKRTAEDLAFAVARFFQFGGTYHGGTNFGRTSGGPYLTTSYDYDAPIDEYGHLNQPKWGHLRELHKLLKSMEKTLTHGNVTNTDYGNSVSATVYATEEGSSCFLANENQSEDSTITFQGSSYNLPAWSVSILPDCKTEEFNTAKVNTQTNVKVKRPNQAGNDQAPLQWKWRPEMINDFVVRGKGHFALNTLIDQKSTNDVSDYLWYMTNADLKDDDPILSGSSNMTLRINSSGQVLHAYVNGNYVDSQWTKYGASNDLFERPVKLTRGKNQISLLSATVGLQNYGSKFDMVPNGIPGPVLLVGRVGDETIIKDLSSHKWTYKVGLYGLDDKKFYNAKAANSERGWSSKNVPLNRRMTWYKTTFEVPLENDPVVLNLQGMGKGFAWVNGYNLGRYWPTYLAEEDGCSTESCDYRGPYGSDKCAYNCGNPSQIWYHVPRSWLKDGVNTLVLFEEFGGNPSQINFQTVVVGTACGQAHENKTMELTCHGRRISEIKYASFGDPQGACGAFKKGSCEAEIDVLPLIEKQCVGKKSCSVEASEANLGATSCVTGTVKRLVVEALC
ncbi:Beta-galactosidase 7 [Citrus sinensis]|uniref:Beta-galactosidase 7 n=1 Tax=Citrus sinensis TaxID=2711 RepID=A0ACB8P498_CITSI|nr:Beta-galactosidase 7 [Citrus sinensis]